MANTEGHTHDSSPPHLWAAPNDLTQPQVSAKIITLHLVPTPGLSMWQNCRATGPQPHPPAQGPPVCDFPPFLNKHFLQDFLHPPKYTGPSTVAFSHTSGVGKVMAVPLGSTAWVWSTSFSRAAPGAPAAQTAQGTDSHFADWEGGRCDAQQGTHSVKCQCQVQ